MITNNDIADAIAALVEKAFPGEKLYRDFTPSGFERPSNLLEISGGKFYPNAACGAVELRPQFTLTTFVEVDPYHQQDDQELTRRQMTLLGLFLPGYVKVRDRAPRAGRGGDGKRAGLRRRHRHAQLYAGPPRIYGHPADARYGQAAHQTGRQGVDLEGHPHAPLPL